MESFFTNEIMQDTEGIQNGILEGVEESQFCSLEPQIMDIEDLGEVLVGGRPFEVADQLDDCQGDNQYNFGGDCGLVTVSNILTMAGIKSSEDSVVGRAIMTGKCHYSIFNDASENGGTTVYQRQELLNTYGISSVIFDSKSDAGSLEAIAEYVEAGHGVNISVNAGYAWEEPSFIGDGNSNHSIVVTGTVRNPESGSLKGLIVCDSGLTDRNSSTMFLSADTLADAYLNAGGTTALVTRNSLA